jgi:crotonobetainyl-CoA:carnitine CoA-transferase CaiB-like acyl-CoA transferase
VRAERSAAGIGAPWLSAPFGVYAAADGYVAISINPLPAVGEALGISELLAFDTDEKAYADRDQVRRILDERLRDRSSAEILDALYARDLWCAKVQDFDEVMNDPQVAHNGLIQEVDHPKAGRIKIVGVPVRFSETPGTIRLAPPLVGEHTDAILDELGYTPEQRADLRARGVV